jgi:peptidoglycan/LPS O-acetylase OafA/YrhL
MIYRREINGLRALAVVPVIFFHAGFKYFGGGFVGVDVFFVISGYLISFLIIEETLSGNFSLVNFYDRRARRILPALFFVVFVSLTLAWFALSPADMKELSGSIKATFLLKSNLFFYNKIGYFSIDAELRPLLHMWSLSVEEQYYLAIPVILFATTKYAKKYFIVGVCLIVVASFIYAQSLLIKDPKAAFFLLPARVWEFLLGAIAAYFVYFKKIQLTKYAGEFISAVGLSLIVYSFVFFDKDTEFPGINALYPTVGAALIIVSANNQNIVGKLLCSKVFVGIGLISYSAYLWHQPLLALARNYSLSGLSDFVSSAIIATVFVLSYFSWRFIETPFRNKNFIGRRQYATGALMLTIIFIGFGVLGGATKGFSFRYPKNIIDPIKDELKAERTRDKCWKELEKNPSISGGCGMGEFSNSRDYALLGDSHAGSLAEFLSEESEKLKLGGINLTYVACQSNPLNDGERKSDEKSVCQKIRGSIYDNIDSGLLPKTIIIASRWTRVIEAVGFDNTEGGIEPDGREFKNQNFTDDEERSKTKLEYINSIRTILDSGRAVFLVYPIPEMGWNVPNRMLSIYNRTGAIDAAAASTKYSAFKDRNKNAYDALDSLGVRKNLYRFYPEKVLCNTYLFDRCVAHIDGRPIYYDDDHLSKFGASLIAKDVLIKVNELR